MAYSEVLQVIYGEGIAKEMEQRILEHATVTVPVVVKRQHPDI